MSLVSFTFNEIQRDVNQDKIFLFILSYEYSLNYNQILTLYNFSSDIFWSFLSILKPILKLGERKATQIKQSATKIYFKLLGSKVELSSTENEYLIYLSQYINDSFSNGSECLHISSIKVFPIKAKGFFLNSTNGAEMKEIIVSSKSELEKYIDSIESIEINGEIYTKTSRLNYMLEKYYGDLTIKELRTKNVKEIIEMMDASSIKKHSEELDILSEKRIEHRRELVYRR